MEKTRLSVILPVAAVLACAFMTGCLSEDSSSTTSEVASMRLTSLDYGAVTNAAGAFIEVPLGAVPTNAAGAAGEMVFSIDSGNASHFAIADAVPYGFTALGDIYGLGPDGFTFERPIRLSLPLPEDFDPLTRTAMIFEYDHTTGGWKSVGGQVSEDGRSIYADLYHLCIDRILVLPASMEWGAMLFPVQDRYCFAACIESFVLKYPAVDAPWFDPDAHAVSVPARESSESPADGMAHWVLPQGTYIISIAAWDHESAALLGYYQQTVTIDEPYAYPGYSTTIVYPAITDLVPGRPPCADEPTPSAGIGVINVRLQWNVNADLDLHVVDPCDQRIYFEALSQTCDGSTGRLDLDNRCPVTLGKPENIFWASDPPRGEYSVYVDHYEDCGGAESAWYTVRTIVEDSVRMYYGIISLGDGTVEICRFTY